MWFVTPWWRALWMLMMRKERRCAVGRLMLEKHGTSHT
jgi:hypothetical protein